MYFVLKYLTDLSSVSYIKRWLHSNFMAINIGVRTAENYKILTDLEKRIFLFVAKNQNRNISISNVANKLAINQVLISRVLTEMQNYKLITKVRDEKNPKIKHPELTTNGKELFSELDGNENKKALILFF